MDTYLPPKYSMNAFFVRHVAHPKRMKYISGLNNAKICAVNDVGFINNFPQEKTNNFPPNNFNEELLKSQSFIKRKERAIPPNGAWSTFGLIDNTDKWRSELNSLASSVGLLTQLDIEEHKRKKDREQMIKNLQNKNPQSKQLSSHSNRPNVSSSTSRLNEPLLTGRRTRGSRASRGVPLTGKNYVVDQAEREAWMLQVLCQILQTESLVDVQSWLVSASDTEKERVKKLIDSAMKGLEESGRINTEPQLTDPIANSSDSITNIENTLQKIHFSQQETQNRLNTAKKAKLPLLMKGDDEALKKKLDSIPEVLKLDHEDNAVIKFETPRSKDYKVEQVKVTMLVKDEKSNSLQEISGDWKP